jgi:hypothetical protein
MKRFLGWAAGLALGLTLGATSARAGNITPCSYGTNCGWSVSIDGVEVGRGLFTVGEKGELGLADHEGHPIDSAVLGNAVGDAQIRIDSVAGNIDPELLFSLSATNSSGAPRTYSAAFSLPLGGLPEPIDSSAEVGITLTPPSTGSVTLLPTSGVGRIVDSQDIRFSPFASVDKGVDVGLGGTATGDGNPLTPDTQFFFDSQVSSIHAGLGPYDLMSVVVAFGLTGNGAAALSGRVTQVVPEPAALVLLGVGLSATALLRRRRSALSK